MKIVNTVIHIAIVHGGGALLLAMFAVLPLFTGCGDKAIGADGTVIATYEWEGKPHHITLEEMQQEISELPEYKQRQYQDKEGLETYMLLMAESRLILSLARDQKLNEDPEILKKVQDYLHELMVKRVTVQEVDDKLALTEDDYLRYYEAHKEDYVRPAQVRLLCITLTDGARADEVFAEIKAGRDIAEVAQELSDRGELVGPGANPASPGDTDYIGRGAFPEGTELFIDAAFAADIGELHDGVIGVAVGSQKYFMMFRKDEARDAYQKPFEEEDVRKNVVRKVEREKRNALLKEWVAQLRARAEVKTYTDRIPEAEPEAEAEPSEPEAEETEPVSPEEAPAESQPE